MLLKLAMALTRYTGVLVNYEEHSPCYLLLTTFTFLNMLNFVYPIGHFMVEHLDSLDFFTNSFGAFCSMTTNLLKTAMFLSTNRTLKGMMCKLTVLTQDKRRSNYELSKEADRQAEAYLKKFMVVIYFSVVGITMSPILAMLMEYILTGHVVDTRWELPFKST